MSSAPHSQQASATPILDRLAPVPPPLRPKSHSKAPWRKVLLPLGMGTSVLAILLIARLDATWTEVLTGRAPLFKLVWTVFVRFLLPVGLATAIHECGHFIAGSLMGYRFSSIRVGPLELARSFSFSVRQYRPGGSTNMAPRVLKASRIRAIVFFFGGPAASLITVFLFLSYSSTSPFLAILAAMSAFMGITNLIPFGRPIASDGRQILMALLRSEEIRRDAALGQILSGLERGFVATERMSPDVVSALIAVREPSAPTAIAHFFAQGASWEKGPNDETARRIEVALQSLSYVPAYWHELACCSAGLFQASKRKNIELAREWLNEIPPVPLHPDLRLRIEAAISETQGDFTAALGQINEIEKVLSQESSSQHGHTIKRLRRWRSEIEEKAKQAAASAPAN
jgi:Zn-dependent protease